MELRPRYGSQMTEAATAKKGYTYKEFTLAERQKRNVGYTLAPPFEIDASNGKLILLSGEETSTFFVRRKSSGVSKSGKSWSRWGDLAMLVISVKPDRSGSRRLNIYVKYRQSKKYTVNFRNGTPNFHTTHAPFFNYCDLIAEIATECVRLYREHIGLVPEWIVNYPAKYAPFLLAYPTVRSRVEIEMSYGRTETNLPPNRKHEQVRTLHTYPSYGLPLRSTTEMEFALKTFGKWNYRKDLVKACSNAELALIFYARQFRNLVPTDWIVKFLQDTTLAREITDSRDKQRDLAGVNEADLRRFLQDVPQNILKRLLTARTIAMTTAFWTMDINDTLRSYRVIADNEGTIDYTPLKKANSWKDVHDYLAREAQKVKTKNHAIPATPLSQKIEKLPEQDNFKVILPKDVHTLLEWGSEMNHCIGSYASNAVSGSDVFIGILQDGKMVGNAQINVKSKKLVQIFGKHNQHIEPFLLRNVVSALVKKKIVAQESLKSAAGYNHLITR